MVRLMSRFANALANANARSSPFLLAGASNQPQTRDAPLSLLMCHYITVKDTTVEWNTTGLDEHREGLLQCPGKVVAHVVISMDRMYNGRAATMNTIASGSLMRWIALAFQQSLLILVARGVSRQ